MDNEMFRILNSTMAGFDLDYVERKESAELISERIWNHRLCKFCKATTNVVTCQPDVEGPTLGKVSVGIGMSIRLAGSLFKG